MHLRFDQKLTHILYPPSWYSTRPRPPTVAAQRGRWYDCMILPCLIKGRSGSFVDLALKTHLIVPGYALSPWSTL